MTNAKQIIISSTSHPSEGKDMDSSWLIGPMPETPYENEYIITLTDYCTKDCGVFAIASILHIALEFDQSQMRTHLL